jgi:protein tyrosine/serine phosphatase
VPGAGLYLGYLHATGNFHEVIAGELYRSAQPSPEQLSD